MRIGIVSHASSKWSAGTSYTKMLILSLSAVSTESDLDINVLAEDLEPFRALSEPVRHLQLESPRNLPLEGPIRNLLRLPSKSQSLPGEFRVRNLIGSSSRSDFFSYAQAEKLDVILPLLDVPNWKVQVKTIGWIPDFQHLYLSEFFSEHEIARRNGSFRRLAANATFVMLSSQAAKRDFENFAPTHADKARVVPFPSLLAFDPPAGDPSESRKRYCLPEKFALVCNQFWRHKNHIVVVEAVSKLRKQGIRIPIVMTGLPVDHRDPTNNTLSQLLQAISAGCVAGDVIMLGQVPYQDLLGLLRCASVLIQPSRFEGWNTTLEDAKAIGCPVICSDIPVHREQAPQALGFFDPLDKVSLAELLGRIWPDVEPGPRSNVEQAALNKARQFARVHGQQLLRLCKDARDQR